MGTQKGKRTKTRDYETYRYVTFGTKRHAFLEQALLEDAKNYANITIGALAALRLEQFYRGVPQSEVYSPQEQAHVPIYLADIVEDIDAADEAWPK